MSFALYETTPDQAPRAVAVGGPLRCVLALLPDLTDEQLSWLKTDGIGHIQRHMVGCEPRVAHPDDPTTLDEATFVAELEAERTDPAEPAGAPQVCDFTGWPADQPLPLELADASADDDREDADTVLEPRHAIEAAAEANARESHRQIVEDEPLTVPHVRAANG